jgi:hypothetical protein
VQPLRRPVGPTWPRRDLPVPDDRQLPRRRYAATTAAAGSDRTIPAP